MSDKIANIKWAQRKNLILLKIDVNGATSEDIQLTADNLSISVTAPSGEIFKFKTDLFAEAVPESLQTKIDSRYVSVSFQKKDEEADFWPRITKVKRKFHNISIDWALWKDEDESEDEEEDLGMGGMGGMPGMGGMGGMPGMENMDLSAMMKNLGGMGGMGGMPDMDDDDDDLPDLEAEEVPAGDDLPELEEDKPE